MKVLHQAGHNTIWNIDSLTQDGVGDGIIFSPVHYDSQKVSNLNEKIKISSLFDPQFYVPDSQKAKLHSYDFFPEVIMNGFDTSDHKAIAHESARLCLAYQFNNHFDAIIIPCRFFEELITDFIDRQKAFTVEPFLNEISSFGTTKLVFISLSLTAPMLLDKRYRTDILNWITSYQEIDGVYLQVDFKERSKQIQDFNKLLSYMEFVEELIEADLEVICGYMNTEGLLASVSDIYAVTVGAYENTRIFSTDKFLINDTIKTGPAPRIYLPNLLNSVRYDTALEIKEDFPSSWDKIYSPTLYSEDVFRSPRKPHFSQPALYKHQLLLLDRQYKEISTLNKEDKVELLKDKITTAITLYEELESNGILFFDSNCKGDHLISWNRVLRRLHT